MSTASAPYYWLTCDHTDCARKSTEDTDYAAWGSESEARDQANYGDWESIEDKDYCPAHWHYDDDSGDAVAGPATADVTP